MSYLLFLVYAILTVLLIKDDYETYSVKSWIVICHLIVLNSILNDYLSLYGALLVLLYSISNKKGNFVDLVYLAVTFFIILTRYSILANIWVIPFVLLAICHSYYSYMRNQPYLTMILSIQLVYVFSLIVGGML